MNKLRELVILFGMAMLFLGCENKQPQEKYANEPVHSFDAFSIDGYIHPLLPLDTVEEKLNTLIRINKPFPYTAHLVYVEHRDWPEKKIRRQRELFLGTGEGIERGGQYSFGEPVPYPIKLRFQLDSVDAPTPIHVDLIHEKHDSSGYLTYYPNRYPKLPDGQPSVIWRAEGLWGIGNLEPGIYRIRIENLKPCPELDFEFLLQFYVNRRKA